MIPLDASILGLPLHPLVVHLVVVALPVGALATIATVLSPWVRTRYGVLSLGTLTVGALSAIVAKVSGEFLAQQEGLPVTHERFGNATMVVALLTSVLAWVWWVLERRRDQAPPGRSSFPALVTGALTVTAALGATGLTLATGHSGAEQVWGAGRDAPAAQPAPSASEPAVFTMADVAAHASPDDCWAAVDGGVYDLTTWIDAHPGGRQRILTLCGTDASAQFGLQHGDAGRPTAQLASLKVGDLG